MNSFDSWSARLILLRMFNICASLELCGDVPASGGGSSMLDTLSIVTHKYAKEIMCEIETYR